MKQRSAPAPSRRTLLGAAAASGVLAAAAPIPATSAAHARQPGDGPDASKDRPRSYHETDHIRTYYSLARF